MNKIVLTVLMISVLVPILIAYSNAQVSELTSYNYIYINADGSVSPSNTPIFTFDNETYTLTDNVNGSIVILRNNTTLDGNGFTLLGDGTYNSIGVDLPVAVQNVTIKSMQIKNFAYGIVLTSSSYNDINGNNITANSLEGIVLNNAHGFYSSENNRISGNNITDNSIGVWINNNSSNNVINGNNVANNTLGIELHSCNYSTVERNSISNNDYGISLNSAYNSTISSNDITSNRNCGIELDSSSYNSINENTFINAGLNVLDSFMNSIKNNTVNGKQLVYLEAGANCSVTSAGQVILVACTNVTVENLDLSKASIGLELCETNGSSISENQISGNNIAGIALYSSSNNTINGNTIEENTRGIYFSSSSGNRIYDNNLMNNTSQISIETFVCASINKWDNGYPSGGNFWSDYNGVDLYNGPNQNMTGYDFIGDIPYVVDPNDIDNYPLMHPFNPETGDFYVAYRTLLENYDTLATNLSLLYSTYQQNLLDYYSLQSNYTSLQNDLNVLDAKYNSLNSSYSNLDTAFNEYKASALSEQSYVTAFLYVLATTTAIFITATVYLLLKKPQIRAES